MSTYPRVVPVTAGRMLRRFVAFPYALHGDAPHWIGPLRRDQRALLDRRRSGFFQHGDMQLFAALDGSGNLVGRVAAIMNHRHAEHFGDGRGFFGFFDTIDDRAVVAAMMEKAGSWLRQRGMQSMLGPVNPTLHETSGILVDGFDREPSVMMPYNLPYYAGLLEGAGFERSMTMWSFYLDWHYVNWPRLRRGADILAQRCPRVRIRTAQMAHFDDEARILFELYNGAFSGTWRFVPITQEAFHQLAGAMRSIIDPNLVLIAEDAGRPVGFVLGLPNVNHLLRHARDGRLRPLVLLKMLLHARLAPPSDFRTVLIGVLPEYRRRGLETALILELIGQGRRHGYRSSELGWVMDDNVVLKNSLQALGGVPEKEYALFEKPL